LALTHEGKGLTPGELVMKFIVLTLVLLTVAARGADNLLQQANEAMRQGRTNEALTLATRAITLEATNAQAWFLRAMIYETLGRHTNAISDFDRAAELDPKPIVFQHRGVEHFRVGNFDKSVADFDKFIALSPQRAPHHWQRGISCYYAGQFDEGRKQFESHKSVNPNDVENAVWHFLCVAKMSGLEKARASFMPIEGDSRVPMKEIHALFAGKATPEQVLAAAKEAKGEEAMFYAHLYLGLYYDAAADKAKTREHILKAARDFKADHYMGDVARAHARVLESKK
jgi:lipoprotein NlpI